MSMVRIADDCTVGLTSPMLANAPINDMNRKKLIMLNAAIPVSVANAVFKKSFM